MPLLASPPVEPELDWITLAGPRPPAIRGLVVTTPGPAQETEATAPKAGLPGTAVPWLGLEGNSNAVPAEVAAQWLKDREEVGLCSVGSAESARLPFPGPQLLASAASGSFRPPSLLSSSSTLPIDAECGNRGGNTSRARPLERDAAAFPAASSVGMEDFEAQERKRETSGTSTSGAAK